MAVRTRGGSINYELVLYRSKLSPTRPFLVVGWSCAYISRKLLVLRFMTGEVDSLWEARSMLGCGSSYACTRFLFEDSVSASAWSTAASTCSVSTSECTDSSSQT